MKLQKALAISDWVKPGLERSNWGLIAQFMSPPKIKRLSLRESRFSNNLFIKPGLSKFGAHTLTNRIGTLNRVPKTQVNQVSAVFVRNYISQGKWDRFTYQDGNPPGQGHFSLTRSLFLMWVSCKNTMSGFKHFEWENTLHRLIAPPKPLIFKLIYLNMKQILIRNKDLIISN